MDLRHLKLLEAIVSKRKKLKGVEAEYNCAWSDMFCASLAANDP